jgi:hypothetical protein
MCIKRKNNFNFSSAIRRENHLLLCYLFVAWSLSNYLEFWYLFWMVEIRIFTTQKNLMTTRRDCAAQCQSFQSGSMASNFTGLPSSRVNIMAMKKRIQPQVFIWRESHDLSDCAWCNFRICGTLVSSFLLCAVSSYPWKFLFYSPLCGLRESLLCVLSWLCIANFEFLTYKF